MKAPFQKFAYGVVVLMFLLLSCKIQERPNLRQTIELKGEWQLKLDTAGVGIAQKWYNQKFTDKLFLPGTLDQNKKGFQANDSSTLHLTRVYYYYGAAWFKHEVIIPISWKDKHIELIMERTKVSHVWIDSVSVGSNNHISVSQVYDLTNYLTAGKHAITIMVDNNIKLVPVGGSHAYSDDTQTNWNGIIGRFYLEASNPTRIVMAKAYPEIYDKLVNVELHIQNPGIRLKEAVVTIEAELWNLPKKDKIPENKYELNLSTKDTIIKLTYALVPKAQLWSEYNPALYKLSVTLSDKEKSLDNISLNFGLSEFKVHNTQFTINDTKVFLRGKHDGCVFPLTGYPPMDVKEWIRIFKIAKMYGINHYRFHSWCPPEAAFMAADMTGMYLQPELPNWSNFTKNDTFHTYYMYREGITILDNYGNHPSFIAISLGNELGGDKGILKQLVKAFRRYDERRLYVQGTNNFFWDNALAKGDYYWITARTGKANNQWSNDVRSSFAFCDARNGGIINGRYPSTSTTYTDAIKDIPVPVIGHEVGQYQVYPNFDEISKYTGVLEARNFQIFRKRLQNTGMINQAKNFLKASGMLSAICYREDIETAIRTPGFGGFQLLDLQDYPGQGTALVGLLDAFLDDKGIISAEEFRQFCNDVVPLLIMNKYCWTNNEIYTAQIKIANYSPATLLNKTIHWIILTDEDKKLNEGTFNLKEIVQGEITSVGKIQFKLNSLKVAKKIVVKISIDGTNYKNKYSFWVYPFDINIKIPPDITIASVLDKALIDRLNNGAKVLLFPDTAMISKKSVPGLFISDFWNYKMFEKISEDNKKPVSPGTLGILTNPNHSIFNSFPTEFYSDWQWWIIIKNSNALILDNTDKNYRPIVQVIDNIDRNHKLGMIFEFKVGKGKLLVCTSNLLSIMDKPEAKQLYYSILKYMESNKFAPQNTISIDKLKELL